uniref:LisH domain-containing protein n=1 Tax=Plectus sambesii TaxID=2011161 RepID=A0A914XTU2_9BILA
MIPSNRPKPGSLPDSSNVYLVHYLHYSQMSPTIVALLLAPEKTFRFGQTDAHKAGSLTCVEALIGGNVSPKTRPYSEAKNERTKRRMAFARESTAVAGGSGDKVSDLMDGLIFGYLSRRHYEATCKAFVDESPSLRQKWSEQWGDATMGTPPSIEISIHGKLLEEIVTMYMELGNFVAPPQFVNFGLKLRQLSSEFATLMGAGWSERQQQLYGRKTTLPTRTQPVSLAGGVRNFQTGPSNFTILREAPIEAVAMGGVDVSSPEKIGGGTLESRRRKAPPRHLANSNVMQSPLKEVRTSEPTTSAFPSITFDSFDTLLDNGLADAVADGINRNLHKDASECQSTAFCDFNAIVDDILSTDNDAVFKAFNIAAGNPQRLSDAGQLSSEELLHDVSADEADLLNGWDPLHISHQSPLKIARIVIDNVEDGEIVASTAAQSKNKAVDLLAKIVDSSQMSCSPSPSLLPTPSLNDSTSRPTKSAKVMPQADSQGSDLPRPASLAIASKSDVVGKTKNKKGNPADQTRTSSSASPSTTTVEAAQSRTGKNEKSKSSSSEPSDRRSEIKKSDKHKEKKEKEKEKEKEKDKDKEKERDDEKKKKGLQPSNKATEKNKRPFGLNHFVTKRLYPEHQCTSTNEMFANSDLFESESPKRKRPKSSVDTVDIPAMRQAPLSKVESARRKLIDCMLESRPISPPSTTSAPKSKDKNREERHAKVVSGDKRRDIYSPELPRVQRSESRSPSLLHQSVSKTRPAATKESSKMESRQKEKSAPAPPSSENRTPNRIIAQKPSPTSSKGSSSSVKRKEKVPSPKSICSGVGKYRPIQLVGGSHSAKVGIVLEKAARARRQAEKEKVDVGAAVVSEAPSASQTTPRPATTSSQLSPPIKSSPLKRTEKPLDDSELIDMSTNTPVTDETDRNLIVLRMIDEAASSPTKTTTTTTPPLATGSVSDLAAYCEQKCGFRLNLPVSPPKKVVRVDNARMESILALLHGTKR